MGILDRARSLFRSPADRRLEAAEREAWQSAPRASASLARRASSEPFAPGPAQPPPTTPRIDWTNAQPAPPPTQFVYAPGYSDHTYQQFAAPLAFEGWDLCGIRGAIAAHRLGLFFQSSALMISILGFAPVLAALKQAVDPILDLAQKAHVRGGDKGLARLVAAEAREQLVPGCGLLPSPYLPPQLWGQMAIYLRMLGFCVLQHVDGDPDPITGVRPRYTRIWEPWAVNYYWSPEKWIALTTEGPVEICNDGKFTLVIDSNRGHTEGAIVAIAEEAFAGKLTQEARNNWIQFFGSPKIYMTLPEKRSTHGEDGDAFAVAAETIYGPDGRGIVPYGTKIDTVALTGEGSKAFQDSLLDAIIHIFMVLTGSAGTIGSGGPTGAGPYQPQKGGPWNVRHDLVARPTIAIVRGINQGHIAPYCDENYSEAIARAKRAGTWEYPTLVVPIDDPDRDQRIESLIKREDARTEIIRNRREVGIMVTQEDADALAEELEVRKVALADIKGAITDKDIEGKLFAPDEVRAAKGYGPLPDGVGSVEQLARERADGRDKTGVVKQTETEDVKPAEGAVPAPPAEETA